MQIVGGFVRVHTDQRRFNLVNSFVESLQADALQLRRKRLLEYGIEVFPKWKGSPHNVLPHSRLRFVHGERRTALERCALIRRVHALLIHGMTGFVHGTEQGGKRIFSFETVCDACIVDTEGGLEGMRGFILPAAVEIVAELLHD